MPSDTKANDIVRKVSSILLEEPYEGMRFILRKPSLINMNWAGDDLICSISKVGEPENKVTVTAANCTTFYFTIVKGDMKKLSPPYDSGWLCWRRECWKDSIL